MIQFNRRTSPKFYLLCELVDRYKVHLPAHIGQMDSFISLRQTVISTQHVKNRRTIMIVVYSIERLRSETISCIVIRIFLKANNDNIGSL